MAKVCHNSVFIVKPLHVSKILNTNKQITPMLMSIAYATASINKVAGNESIP